MQETIYLERFAIPLDLLMKVKEHAPQAAPVTGVDARTLVRIFATYAEQHDARTGKDGQRYWITSFKVIADLYGEAAKEENVAPNALGIMINGMGLTKIRRNDGYYAAWTRAQIDILKKHFGL